VKKEEKEKKQRKNELLDITDTGWRNGRIEKNSGCLHIISRSVRRKKRSGNVCGKRLNANKQY
jgi:hypothetical protein